MEYKVNSWKEIKKLTYETEFEIGDKIVFENCQVLVDEKPHTRVWQYVGKDRYGKKCFQQINYETVIRSVMDPPTLPQFINAEEEK